MENNIKSISDRIQSLVDEYSPFTTKNIQFQILDTITDELLSEIGIPTEMEEHENIKRALLNMFVVGSFYPTK